MVYSVVCIWFFLWSVCDLSFVCIWLICSLHMVYFTFCIKLILQSVYGSFWSSYITYFTICIWLILVASMWPICTLNIVYIVGLKFEDSVTHLLLLSQLCPFIMSWLQHQPLYISYETETHLHYPVYIEITECLIGLSDICHVCVFRSLKAERLEQHLKDMKSTVMSWGSWVRTPVGSNLGCVILQSWVETWNKNILCSWKFV